jgi:hypothetical protein
VAKPRRSSKAGTSKDGTSSPLPHRVQTALGAVPVVPVEQPTDSNGTKAFGTFDLENRVIEIKSALCHATARQVFLHECIHIALWDAGVQLTGDQEEAVCTSVATFLLVSDLTRL